MCVTHYYGCGCESVCVTHGYIAYGKCLHFPFHPCSSAEYVFIDTQKHIITNMVKVRCQSHITQHMDASVQA